MKKKSFLYVAAPVIIASLVFSNLPSFAQEDPAQLKQQIADLQKRIEMLDPEKQDEIADNRWNPFRGVSIRSRCEYNLATAY